MVSMWITDQLCQNQLDPPSKGRQRTTPRHTEPRPVEKTTLATSQQAPGMSHDHHSYDQRNDKKVS